MKAGGKGGKRATDRDRRRRVLGHPRQDFQAALRVIAAGPPRMSPLPGQEEKEAEIMLTVGEQQELCQIERDLSDADRGFAWRLTLLPGVLRWAGPGREVYLLALAALAAALLRLAAAARRLMMAFAQGAMLLDPTGLIVVLGDTAWLGWETGQAPGRGASTRPRPGGPGTR